METMPPGTYNRKDHLYQRAKDEGYRSRAAYKLQEINQKYKILRPGSCIVDLGSFPGGWLQVALEAVGPKGKVIGIDLRDVDPVRVRDLDAHIIKGDAFDRASWDQIISLAGAKADVVLSDMSPQLSGIKFKDAVRSAELVELALNMSTEILEKGGTLVTKIFPGAECEQLSGCFKKHFRSFTRATLKSTRKTSNEIYFIARDFLGTSETDS